MLSTKLKVTCIQWHVLHFHKSSNWTNLNDKKFSKERKKTLIKIQFDPESEIWKVILVKQKTNQRLIIQVRIDFNYFAIWREKSRILTKWNREFKTIVKSKGFPNRFNGKKIEFWRGKLIFEIWQEKSIFWNWTGKI